MRSKASCREAPEYAAPKSISPIPTAPTRSTKAARSQSASSFDVLHLLPQFFDLRFDFHAGGLREHGVGFAMHFLQQKIQLLPQLPSPVEQLRELLQVASQPV